MRYFIGTDEAGYGPNLGPLVIAASIWRAKDRALESEGLYESLSEVCTALTRDEGDHRLWLADSKQVYSPAQGLAELERGVLGCLELAGHSTASWNALCERLSIEPSATANVPWHAGFDPELPRVCGNAHSRRRVQTWQRRCRRVGVELIGLVARVVFPDEFNRLCVAHGSKGELLSRLTFALVAAACARAERAPCVVICDKHGGRNFYQRLLQEQFDPWLVEVRGESRAQSVYTWGPAESRIELRLCTRSERFLPAAVASMTAKYVRELSMEAFNVFWQTRVPGLRPTAGYPGDATRFRREITAAQAEMGLDDLCLWRNR